MINVVIQDNEKLVERRVPGFLQYNRFPNGELAPLDIERTQSDSAKAIIYYAPERNSEIKELNLVSDFMDIPLVLFEVINQTNIKDVVINLEYLPYSRMDKPSKPFLEISLTSFIKSIYHVSNYSEGLFNIEIVFNDVHNKSAIEDIINKINKGISISKSKVEFTFNSYMEEIVSEAIFHADLSSEKSSLVVLYPDQTAKTRYQSAVLAAIDKQTNPINFVELVSTKQRNQITGGIIELKIEDTKPLQELEVKGLAANNILVVDDLIVGGASVLKSLDVLQESLNNYIIKSSINEANILLAMPNVEAIFYNSNLYKRDNVKVFTNDVEGNIYEIKGDEE